jgi:hypothetical protein
MAALDARPADFRGLALAFYLQRLLVLKGCVVTQRPRDLTRADLRALRLELEEPGSPNAVCKWRGATPPMPISLASIIASFAKPR